MTNPRSPWAALAARFRKTPAATGGAARSAPNPGHAGHLPPGRRPVAALFAPRPRATPAAVPPTGDATPDPAPAA